MTVSGDAGKTTKETRTRKRKNVDRLLAVTADYSANAA